MSDQNLIIRQLELGSMGNFSYLIGDQSSGEAALIDPSVETDTIENTATKAGLKITKILLTHGHYDHVGGLHYFSDQQQLPVYLSKDEFGPYTPNYPTLQKLADNDILSIGKFRITCIHTPGHSTGCMCFYVTNNLFTGDTLFIDAIGRSDLPGGDAATLFNSLQKIKQLPDETMIWPGHNYGNTSSRKLQQLKVENPFLACDSKEKFLSFT